ncbi:phage holin family protein [Alteromonas gracilis]
MSTPTPSEDRRDEQTLGALIHQLSEQVPQLVRTEVQLAQAELTAKGKAAGVGIGAFGAAGVLALYAVLFLLTAAALGLALVVPGWAAALIVGVAVLVAAGVAAMVGKREVTQAVPPAPERTIENVKEDVATIKGKHS